MARHTISMADRVFRGPTSYPGYDSQGGYGVEIPDIDVVQYGAVATASANAICLSQSITAGTAALLNGATAGTLDVPRNVVAAWTNTAVMTVVGTDQYGRTMSEASASGTSFTGKKAFKTITSINVSANTTGHTVGTGDVLGLPFRLDNKAQLLSFVMDGASDAVTSVVADTTDPATTTTGDVRGTVDFTTASNGTRRFTVMMIRPSDKSNTGLFGVTQV